MRLARAQLFDLWAPNSSPWSVWAKPVLFAQAWDAELEPPAQSLQLPTAPPWAPRADGATIIVADLPGSLAVHVAEALAHAGFRPVPLFNAIPAPTTPADDLPLSPSIVDVEPIVAALHAATERSGEALRALAPNAPPVFLLDSARRLGRTPRPGDFDNRSISLPTDFPSAAFLSAHGVTQVLLLVAEHPEMPATDLSHTLLRWQTAGIPIHAATIDDKLEATAPRPIHVRKPKWFRAIWHNALSLLGLQRNPLGGFGGTLPVPSAG